MASKDYLKSLNTQARKKSLQLTMLQDKKIMNVYKQMGDDLLGKLFSSNSTVYQKKMITEKINFYNQQVENIVKEHAELQANAVLSAQMAVFKDIFKDYEFDKGFLNKFGNIDKECVNYIIKGDLYKNGKGLSERIWNTGTIQGKNIQDIIIEGKLQGQSAVDIAKTLQAYINSPNSSAWVNACRKLGSAYASKITKANISYEALRLARTTLAHTAQVSIMTASKFNPFVDGLKWNISNSNRVCDICKARNGVIYKKTDVPFDHPNGMCYQTAEISKDGEQIAQEVRDWMMGGDNKELDRWAEQMKGFTKEGSNLITTKANNTTATKKEYKTYARKLDLMNSELTSYGKSYVSSLQKNEYNALKDYTGSHYYHMNNQLRDGRDFGEAERIRLASQAIKKFSNPYDLTVYRGTDLFVIKDLFADSDEYMDIYEKILLGEATEEFLKDMFVGGTIVDKGFMSTSAYKGGAFSKDVTYHIQVDEGSNYGAYVNELSNFKDTECEFLLDAGLITEITDVKVNSEGKLALYLKILGYAK